MDKDNNNLFGSISIEVLKKILSCDIIKVSQLNTVMLILIKNCIPFDIEYSPGTRRNSPSVVLSVYINPNSVISFEIEIDNTF